jgi:hypothetical protein
VAAAPDDPETFPSLLAKRRLLTKGLLIDQICPFYFAQRDALQNLAVASARWRFSSPAIQQRMAKSYRSFHFGGGCLSESHTGRHLHPAGLEPATL